MKYCIIYAETNLMAGEKISLGLVCVYENRYEFRYSPHKIAVSQALVPEPQGKYINTFVTRFEERYLKGYSTASILSSLDTLHRYSNNLVIFSSVHDLNLPESECPYDSLYKEMVAAE